MPILFVAIRPPAEIATHLSLVQGGIPGARWEPEEKLHLTLRYLGQVEGGTMRAVTEVLSTFAGSGAPALTLRGVGTFPPRGAPRSLWVGVEDPAPLVQLHTRLEHRLRPLDGVAPDARKFAPHLTLARLKDAPPAKVAAFLAHHALLQLPTFPVERLWLMSSVRSPGGSSYRVEAAVSLTRSAPTTP